MEEEAEETEEEAEETKEGGYSYIGRSLVPLAFVAETWRKRGVTWRHMRLGCGRSRAARSEVARVNDLKFSHADVSIVEDVSI